MVASTPTWINGGFLVSISDMSIVSLINSQILWMALVPVRNAQTVQISAMLWKHSISVKLYLIQPNQVDGKKLVKLRQSKLIYNISYIEGVTKVAPSCFSNIANKYCLFLRF